MTRTIASNPFMSANLLLGILILFMSTARSTGENEEEETDLGEVIQYVDGDILIAVFAPITTRGGDMKCVRKYAHPAMAEQVNIFLKKINSNSSILPGIKLGAIVINSCHSETHSVRKLFRDIILPYVIGFNCTRSFCKQEKRILAGVVGAVRSAVSMDIASFLNIYEISQVSFWSTSTDLSDKSRFKYFFRNVPSDSVQAEAMADFIEKQGWNYVSVVYNDDAYGIKGFQEVSKSLKERGICSAVTLPLPLDSDDTEVEQILHVLVENEKARAVILFASSSSAFKVLKKANDRDEWKGIAWIASDGWAGNLPDNDDSYVDVIDGTIGFSLKFPSMDRLNKRVQNLTIKDYRGENATLNPWWQDYVKFRKNCTTSEGTNMRQCDEDESIPDYKANGNALDEAMEVFVHAIADYHRVTCPSVRGVCDAMTRIADTNDVARALYQHMRNVSFRTSGRTFKFDSFQDGPPLYNIVAFAKNKTTKGSIVDGWYTVGTYDEIQNVSISKGLPHKVTTLKSVCSDVCGPGYATISSAEACCWVCQKCTDRSYVSQNSCQPCGMQEMPNSNRSGCIPIPIQEMRYSSGYAIACLSFGIFGLVCTIIMFGMYWKHRDTAIVRASGRELCFFVLGGVAFTLLNCFTITAHPSEISCGFTRIIMALGPALIYAGLLMKTFRVVFIFQSKGILSSRTKGYLEPGPLIFLTICVTLIQIIVVTIWMVLSPPTVYVFYSETAFEAFRTCKHIVDERVYVGLAYPFLIIIICTVLATVNRNVPTGFRETLFVGFTMYTTCVTWIAFQVLFFTNVDQHRIERQLTTLSCALSISAITVLLCLFGPRCYTILRHPELNTSDVVMSRRGNGHCSRDPGVPHDPVGTVAAGVVNKAFSNISNGHAESL